MKRPKPSGFTLIEIIAVIIVLGILTAIALPNYNIMKERQLGKEAVINLKLIAEAEKSYRMDHGTYYPVDGYTTTDISKSLKLSLSNSNWLYAVQTASASKTFFVTAYRDGTGGYSDCEYLLTADNSSGDPPEPVPNSSCP